MNINKFTFMIDKLYNKVVYVFNPIKTKLRPFYLKTQSVPRSKHFSSRL